MSTKPPIGPSWAVAPTQWGARLNYDLWNDPWVPMDKLVIHYGGGSNWAGDLHPEPAEQMSREMSMLRQWEKYHMTPKAQGGKGMRGVAYCYAIGQSGTLYRLRGFNHNGGHWNSDDIEPDGISENKEALPVVFILGGKQQPTPLAYMAFELFRAYAETALNRPLPLYGHWEVAASGGHSTDCPGTILIPYVRSHRNSGGSPPTPIPAPPAPTDDWPLLRQGMRHGAVGKARAILEQLGHIGLAWPQTRTLFTAALERATRRFQATHPPLRVDGIIGPATEAALKAARP